MQINKIQFCCILLQNSNHGYKEQLCIQILFIKLIGYVLIVVFIIYYFCCCRCRFRCFCRYCHTSLKTFPLGHKQWQKEVVMVPKYCKANRVKASEALLSFLSCAILKKNGIFTEIQIASTPCLLYRSSIKSSLRRYQSKLAYPKA